MEGGGLSESYNSFCNGNSYITEETAMKGAAVSEIPKVRLSL